LILARAAGADVLKTLERVDVGDEVNLAVANRDGVVSNAANI